MDAILVRIGIDQEYGGWNAPVDANSRRFVYVPIPESQEALPGFARLYDEIPPALERFSVDLGLDHSLYPTLPPDLPGFPMHLDPDFECLTYGDNGDDRGAKVKKLARDDIVVFYAGLRAIGTRRGLLYALVGLFVVDRIERAKDVPRQRWHENAHTRKVKIGEPDIIVRAQRTRSGRLERAIPIGEWRNRAYRVTNEMLKIWAAWT